MSARLARLAGAVALAVTLLDARPGGGESPTENALDAARTELDLALGEATAAVEQLRGHEERHPSFWEQEPRQTDLLHARQQLDQARIAASRARSSDALTSLREATALAVLARRSYQALWARWVEPPPAPTPTPPPAQPAPATSLDPIPPAGLPSRDGTSRPGQPTRPPRVVDPPAPRYPTALLEASDLYLQARYDEAMERLVGPKLDPPDELLRLALLAASAHARFELGGGKDPAHLAIAREAMRELGRSAPAWSPPAELFSSRFLAEYEAARSTATSAAPGQ